MVVDPEYVMILPRYAAAEMAGVPLVKTPTELVYAEIGERVSTMDPAVVLPSCTTFDPRTIGVDEVEGLMMTVPDASGRRMFLI